MDVNGILQSLNTGRVKGYAIMADYYRRILSMGEQFPSYYLIAIKTEFLLQFPCR